jgi:uncharacterized protein (UPF0147 family)
MRESIAPQPIAEAATALIAVLDALAATDATPRLGRRVGRECLAENRDETDSTLVTLALGLRALQEIDGDEDLLEVPPPPCRSRWTRMGGFSRARRCQR